MLLGVVGSRFLKADPTPSIDKAEIEMDLSPTKPRKKARQKKTTDNADESFETDCGSSLGQIDEERSLA